MNFGTDKSVFFKEDTHQYFNLEGDEYNSVSSVLKLIKRPFDRKGISRRMAQSRALNKKDEAEVSAIQRQILSEWDMAKDDSLDKGNFIHDNLEDYHYTGEYDPKLKRAINYIDILLKESTRSFPEALVFNHHYKVAGQSDLVIQRQRSKSSIFDFYDYKTNQSKGIEFDSIGRKKNPIKHYNRFLLPPLDHLEDCNYNLYSLQLSTYAFLAKTHYGIRPGRLGIIFVDNHYKPYFYPVVYMEMEVRALLEHKINLRSLPG